MQPLFVIMTNVKSLAFQGISTLFDVESRKYLAKIL